MESSGGALNACNANSGLKTQPVNLTRVKAGDVRLERTLVHQNNSAMVASATEPQSRNRHRPAIYRRVFWAALRETRIHTQTKEQRHTHACTHVQINKQTNK